MCILPVATYGLETILVTKRSADHFRLIQRTMKTAMLGISLRNKIRNKEFKLQWLGRVKTDRHRQYSTDDQSKQNAVYADYRSDG